ncbi:Kinesin-like protein KIN-6 [Bienertia sinuspersici]
MENCSPHQCPSTATIRRNPPRRARATPLNTAIKAPKDLNNVPNFPLNDILSMDLQHQQKNPTTIPSSKPSNSSDSLNVFLRVRPLPIAPSKSKQVKVKKPTKSCLIVNDPHSVTVTPPTCDTNRLKSEVYNGFSHVFSSDSSQDEVYEKLMRPVVEEFLNGRSGLLAALGPSGSGKTHTVFGSAKEPGLVPRVLRHMFEPDKGNPSRISRLFYLSIFEIYSEKGKGEKLSDLSPEGSDLHMQQSVVKGLKETLVKDVAQAESLLDHAKSKRVTAMTNSNSQSSRSQCIISIRCAVDEVEGESESLRSEAVLTFVDLAGAEREKKTGNKGGRLLEIIVGASEESQETTAETLSELTANRYLRDYLEGRKRMSLILTVRSGEEDYFDTSSLLRQASPFMEIKFRDMEEISNLPHTKRRRQIIGNEQQKRAKLCVADAKDDIEMTCQDSEDFPKGNKRNHVSQVDQNSLSDANYTDSNIQRQYNIMKGFAKALWTVLKEYKERVMTMQKDIDNLTESLGTERAQYLIMEKELLKIKSRFQGETGNTCAAESRLSGEELTNNGKVVSSEVQVFADIECKEKETLHTVGENCTSHHEGDLVGVMEPEDSLECSRSECKSTNQLWEKDVQFDGEVSDTLTPEVRCPCTDSEGRPDKFFDSKEKSRSESIKLGSQSRLQPGSAIVSKVDLGDFPSAGKSFLSVDDSIKLDVTLTEASDRATLSSSEFKISSPQNYQVQRSLECQISKDRCENDFHKDLRKECSKKSTASGDAAHIPRSPVTDLIVQDESCGHETPSEKDKENVAVCPETAGSNIKSELEIKEVSSSKPSISRRPKRRLMPASSLLLRDAGNIDTAEENVKLGGGRSGRKLNEDEHKRTKGSDHLLRLLKNHLPR